MLQAAGIVKAYGSQVLFNGVSFTLGPGERAGLAGRNGSGKTTLLRMIAGLEQPDEGALSVPRGYRVGYLSQHIHFISASVLEEAMLGLAAGKTPDEDPGLLESEAYKARAVLMGLGFRAEDFSRHPLELSGGFQVRLNLARLLLEAPGLLLLDEPTNYLDIVSSRWLGQFLRNWKGELLLITHDRGFMDSVTTHTIGIHRAIARKVAGGTDKLYEQILAQEELHERTRANDEKRRGELEEFINRFRAQATRASAVQSRIKGLQKKERLEKLSREKELEFGFNFAPHESKWLMKAENLSFAFGYDESKAKESKSKSTLFRDLSFSVGRSDRIAVIGPNGQGKTTLIRLLAGELAPCTGSVSYAAKTALAHFGQTNVSRLDASRTVEEEIMASAPELGRGAARNICGAMLFGGDSALKKISVLSGGEKSRVLLGRVIAQPANLLLLDEPTNHLDMESVDALVEAMEAFEGAVVMVTHSELVLRALATRLVVFGGGQARVFEGTYEDFLARSGWVGEEAGGLNGPGAGTGKSLPGGEASRRKPANRKDMRRARAGLIAERSRVLGELQQSISEAEEKIMGLERQVENDNLALISASTGGDGLEIKRLSKSIHEAKGRIETLFDELAAATEELEKHREGFEARLAGLDEGG